MPIALHLLVIFTTDDSVVQTFQLIDFMSMQGITAAAHRLGLGNMSNGANFTFSKDAYIKAGGYSGVDQLASGDDYLLMMKLNKMEPGRVSYLKTREAIITTTPQPDWRSFLQQRIRWASKSGKYDDRRLTLILLLVYLFNVSFFVVFAAGFYDAIMFKWLAGMFVIKVFAEIIFLRPVAKFFGKEFAVKYLPVLQPIHILYIVVAGLFGFVGRYEWKGRRVR
jgi:cellulose synthase/poly-beta-1,6-N-acetylglucosamine synthase-like glycosyltransferase